jgi:hypothetical protein
MRYKLLGRTGLRASELCLGAMTFDLVDHHRGDVYTEPVVASPRPEPATAGNGGRARARSR